MCPGLSLFNLLGKGEGEGKGRRHTGLSICHTSMGIRERERVGPNNRVFARLPPPARTSTPQVFCPGRGIMILPPLPFTLPSSLTVQQIFCSSFPLTRESSLSLKHQLSSALFCYPLVSCKFLRLLRIRPLRASCSATRSARSPAPWSSSPAASSSSSLRSRSPPPTASLT